MPSSRFVTPTPAIMPQLKKVLDILVQKDYVQDEIKTYKNCAKHNILRRPNLGKALARVCKECLCAHRFEAASKLLEILCLEQSAVDHFVFMAGMQILENHPSSSENDVINFIRQIQYLRRVNKNEILLEFLNYVLRNNITTAGAVTESIATRLRGCVLKKNFIIDPLTKAYLALFDYIEWAGLCKQGGKDVEETAPVAEKAISIFAQILELPGQNDIFVTKLVEMLEYYERYEEAELHLVKYVEVNPTHINAYMYLCAFLRKHNHDSEKLIKYLKKLAKLNPSDPFVLVLVDELKGKNHGNEKSLKLLFWFLDCPEHTGNLKAWKKLSKLVFNVLQYPVPTESNVMRACWDDIRTSFWNSVHFSVKMFQLNDSASAKVAVHKAIVLSVLEESHPYVEAVLDKLPHVSEKLFSRLKRKLAAVDDLKNNINEQSYPSEEEEEMDLS